MALYPIRLANGETLNIYICIAFDDQATLDTKIERSSLDLTRSTTAAKVGFSPN